MLVLKSNVAFSNANLPQLPQVDLNAQTIMGFSPTVWTDFDSEYVSLSGSDFSFVTDRAVGDIYLPANTYKPQLLDGAGRKYLRFGNVDNGASLGNTGLLTQQTQVSRLSSSGVHTIAYVWRLPRKDTPTFTVPWDGGTGYGGSVIGSGDSDFRVNYFRGPKDADDDNGRALVPWQAGSNFDSYGFYHDYLGEPSEQWNMTVVSWSVADGRVLWRSNGSQLADELMTVPAMSTDPNSLYPVIGGAGDTLGDGADSWAGDLASVIYLPDVTIWDEPTLLTALEAHLNEVKAAL